MVNEKYQLVKQDNLYVTEVLGRKYAFRKWTWGEKNILTAECSQINPISGFISFDSVKFNEGLVLKTVLQDKNGKFEPFTTEEVRALDGQLGERLFKITQQLNLVSQVEAQNL
jgi:hypothetical protein